MRSENDDRRRLRESEAVPQGYVRLDLRDESAGGIHDEGHLEFLALKVMRGKPLAREGLKIVLRRDAVLVVENVAAKLLSDLGRDLVLQVTRGDRRVARPDVVRNQEVVPVERNLVVLDGGVGNRERMRAGWALEILEVEDSGALPRRQLQHGSVLERITLAGGDGILGVQRGGCRENDYGGKGEGGETMHRRKTHKGHVRYFSRNTQAADAGRSQIETR